ncbi:transposase [Candidatus Enterovibrio escicola]|uniref:transposase n=1 Tax=Candidatus Enterovibrio escicola TaxID=1927127 RepID=UPI001237DEB1|nr:transposase [Candidatus Enterovibrio escacola]
MNVFIYQMITDMPWRALPRLFGEWRSVCRRFNFWQKMEILVKFSKQLSKMADS